MNHLDRVILLMLILNLVSVADDDHIDEMMIVNRSNRDYCMSSLTLIPVLSLFSKIVCK